MSEIVFLIVNASVVCFIASYCLLKVFRSKVLLIGIVASPFLFIPLLHGWHQAFFVGYLFVLQYGCLGIAFGIILFEIDQIKRARKLRYLTSFLAKIAIIFPCIYIFFYLAKVMVANSQTVENSLEVASLFGLVDTQELNIVNYLASYFHTMGAMVAIVIILLCICVLILNKYRAFKEVQRI